MHTIILITQNLLGGPVHVIETIMKLMCVLQILRIYVNLLKMNLQLLANEQEEWRLNLQWQQQYVEQLWENSSGTMFLQNILKKKAGELLQCLLVTDLHRKSNSDLSSFLLVLWWTLSVSYSEEVNLDVSSIIAQYKDDFPNWKIVDQEIWQMRQN